MKNQIIILAVCWLIFSGCQQAKSPDYFLTVKGVKITVAIAADEESRAKGLMFRQSLPANSGMLFIFPDEAVRNFWMKNTPLPLSIAYISSNGTIIDIRDMTPYSTENIVSAGPAKYALEMKQGWFKENSIKSGDAISLSPDIISNYLSR